MSGTLLIRLVTKAGNPDREMICQLLEDLAPPAGFHLQKNDTAPDGEIFWGVEAPENAPWPVVSIPRNSRDQIPKQVLSCPNTGLPVPAPGGFCKSGSFTRFHFDLFSFLAGQLYRAEEYLEKNADASFSANSKPFLGEQFRFFHRPVVDLWLHELTKFFGEKTSDNSKLRIWMTHDVDSLQKWSPRGMLASGWQQPREAFRCLMEGTDPYDNIDDILQNEKNIPATFFFLGHTKDGHATRYDIRRKRFAKRARQCLATGKEVGLHGSPLHAADRIALEKEVTTLSFSCQTDIRFSRQHYLGVNIRQTFYALESAGIRLDSSLAFNNRTGFRCGTCHPFRWWDLKKNTGFELVELPVVLGDWQLHDPTTAVLPDNSLQSFQNVMNAVREVNGIATLLFHNVYYSPRYFPAQRKFNQDCLDILQHEKSEFLSAADILALSKRGET